MMTVDLFVFMCFSLVSWGDLTPVVTSDCDVSMEKNVSSRESRMSVDLSFACICRVSWQRRGRVRFFRRDAATGRHVFPQQPAQLHHWAGVFDSGHEGKAAGGRQQSVYQGGCPDCSTEAEAHTEVMLISAAPRVLFYYLSVSMLSTFSVSTYLPQNNALCNWI